jgi:hypothetical protein
VTAVSEVLFFCLSLVNGGPRFKILSKNLLSCKLSYEEPAVSNNLFMVTLIGARIFKKLGLIRFDR